MSKLLIELEARSLWWVDTGTSRESLLATSDIYSRLPPHGVVSLSPTPQFIYCLSREKSNIVVIMHSKKFLHLRPRSGCLFAF
jgi:hypothetical protein